MLQELCVNSRRKTSRPLDLKTTREIIADYISWEIVVSTGEAILEALKTENRYGISFWDALVIQVAESPEAAVLNPEELADGETFGAARVVNPLVVPHAPL